MYRPARIPPRARAIALPRPQTAVVTEWIVAAVAVAVILAGLLAS
jgi:hypothetical protein